MDRLNHQETKELSIFQRFVVQGQYIKQLNLWLDELEWENEKKERIIEMKDEEIAKLNDSIIKKIKELNELGNRFNELNRKYESLSSKGGKLLIRRGVFPK